MGSRRHFKFIFKQFMEVPNPLQIWYIQNYPYIEAIVVWEPLHLGKKVSNTYFEQIRIIFVTR